MSRLYGCLIVLMAGLAAFSLAQAQENAGTPETESPNQPQRERGDRPRRDRGDRPRGGPRGDTGARFSERMMEMLKQQSGSSDEEWKSIEPKLRKVLDAQRSLRGGFGMGMRRPDGPRDRADAENPLARAQRDLRAALQDTSTSPDAIREKLATFREERQKTRTELEAAQKELKGSANPRQEAALVLAGILE